MEKRWRSSDRAGRGGRPPGSVLVALLLACATLITLDHQGGEDSALEPARLAVGEVLGPVETFTAAVVRPFAAVPDYFHSRQSLREDADELEAENVRLRSQLASTDLDRNRLAEYDALTRAADDAGRSVVPAHVIAHGAAQSFSATVTIDAGSDAGIRADMTVLNGDGLVGRVLRTTHSTATVLLILDADSVVGGRLGKSMEIGFLRGRGEIGDDGRLDLDLVDQAVAADAGDVVSTWGSEGGSPYVAGIPIGRVESVTNTPRDTSRRAVIEPFVDFTALDTVGVVVPDGTESDRDLIEAAR